MKLGKNGWTAITSIAIGIVVVLASAFLVGRMLQATGPIKTAEDYKFVVDDMDPCGGLPIISSIVDESGFVNIAKPFDDYNAFREFIIKPSSTGLLTMTYDFGNLNKEVARSTVDGIYHKNLLTGSIGIYTINPDPSSIDKGNSLVRLQDEKTEGLSVQPIQVTNETASKVKVVYEIKTNNSAAEGKSYIFTLFHVCRPGEMLTVGEKPHEGSLQAWDKATWY